MSHTEAVVEAEEEEVTAEGGNAPAEWGEAARRARGFNVLWHDFTAFMSRTVETIFQMGTYLEETKEAIKAKKEDWLDVFDPNKVAEPITFGLRTPRAAQDRAERLMFIT